MEYNRIPELSSIKDNKKMKSNVKKIMHEKGYTIRGLMGASGVTHRTIVKARTDAGIAECRLSTLKRIADCLNVSVKDLFEDINK